jgi:hypothetical protein
VVALAPVVEKVEPAHKARVVRSKLRTMPRTFTLLALMVSIPAMAQSPAFHWRLDESSGTMAQASTGGSNGVLAGGVQWSPNGGHHQGAARFDGVDDRIVLGSCDLTNGGQSMSISMWVKPDFVTAMERTLIAKATGPQATDHVWSIAFVNATSLRFRLRTAGTTKELTTPPSSLFGGTWYHIVANYDGSEMRLYVNASLVGSTSKTGAVDFAPQAPAALGATSTGGQPFSGWLDDVRIYDRSLTDAEIIDLLFETITTGLNETSLTSLFRSDWTKLEVYDATGRLVAEHGRGGEADVPRLLGTGFHVVRLHGTDWSTASRIAVR